MLTALAITSLILPILVPGIVLITALKRNWFPALDLPVDGGSILGGSPVLGRAKTWRGVIIYILGAVIVSLGLSVPPLAGLVAEVFTRIPVITGLAIGCAYCLGELANSFVKRRLGIRSSESARRSPGLQKFIDLADGIVVAVLAYVLLGVPPLLALAAGGIGIAVHAGTDVLMRKLRLKQHQHQRGDGGDREIVDSPMG